MTYPVNRIGTYRHMFLSMTCRQMSQQLRDKYPDACHNMTPRRLGQLERGELKGRMSEREAIAAELGMSTEELFR